MNTQNALRVAVSTSDTTLELASPSDFQLSGIVLIGSELIAYTHASDHSLIGCTRGWGGTTAATHAKGAAVTIQADASLLLTLAAVTVPTLPAVTTTERGYITLNGTATITVTDYASLSGATVTVNGYTYTEGSDWTAATNNNTTASSLRSALHSAVGTTGVDAAVTNNVITLTASNPGIANNFAISSSDAVRLALSSATLVGGLPATGMRIFNTTTNKVNMFNGTAWVDEVVISSGASQSPISIVASDPSSPTEGQVWYNTTSHVLKFYNGSATKTVTTN